MKSVTCTLPKNSNLKTQVITDAGGRGNVSWEFIHGLLELAIYGGRVDNPFDSRVLMSYLKQFFNSEVISEQNRGSKKLGPMSMPTSTQYRVRYAHLATAVCLISLLVRMCSMISSAL